MPSLRSKQLLVKVSRLTKKEQEKISRKEIEKRMNQIKYLSDQDEIPKTDLRKEIVNLEHQLQGVFILEKKMNKKAKENDQKIIEFKKQIGELKEKISTAKDVFLRRKVNRLSHLINDMVAKKEIKKEVQLEEYKKKAEEKVFMLTLKKIDQLQSRILALKRSKKYPPEEIAQLEERLTAIEKRFNPDIIGKKKLEISSIEPIKHTMISPAEMKPIADEVQELEKDIDELPLPPPPRIKKR
ncbi:MAG: hypothetical protein ABIA37_05080 [Candidatus Woesearchaeota archaeon]